MVEYFQQHLSTCNIWEIQRGYLPIAISTSHSLSFIEVAIVYAILLSSVAEREKPELLAE